MKKISLKCKKNLKIPKGNHNPYIEGQTTQWLKETKNIRTNNDLQNITHKLEIEKHAPH